MRLSSWGRAIGGAALLTGALVLSACSALGTGGPVDPGVALDARGTAAVAEAQARAAEARARDLEALATRSAQSTALAQQAQAATAQAYTAQQQAATATAQAARERSAAEAEAQARQVTLKATQDAHSAMAIREAAFAQATATAQAVLAVETEQRAQARATSIASQTQLEATATAVAFERAVRDEEREAAMRDFVGYVPFIVGGTIALTLMLVIIRKPALELARALGRRRTVVQVIETAPASGESLPAPRPVAASAQPWAAPLVLARADDDLERWQPVAMPDMDFDVLPEGGS